MTKKKFKFKELSDDAKQYVIEHYFDDFPVEFDCVLEDAATMADLFGLDIRNTRTKNGNYKPSVHYSLGYCQGDYASVSGMYHYKPGAGAAIEKETGGSDDELQRIADTLEALQFANGYSLTAECTNQRDCQQVSVDLIDESDDPDWPALDEATEDTLSELLKDFAAWIYKRIKDEYEYQTSEDAVADNCDCNDYRFDREGVML